MRLDPRDLLPKRREKGAGVFGDVDDFRWIGFALLAMVVAGVWVARKYRAASATSDFEGRDSGGCSPALCLRRAAAWANFPPPELREARRQERKPKLELVIVRARKEDIVLRGSADNFDKISLAVENAVDAAIADAPAPESPKK